MLTTQLYRPGAHTSNLRSMSRTIARTAIPITHYRILTKKQPAATARLVATRSSADASAGIHAGATRRDRSAFAEAILTSMASDCAKQAGAPLTCLPLGLYGVGQSSGATAAQSRGAQLCALGPLDAPAWTA